MSASNCSPYRPSTWILCFFYVTLLMIALIPHYIVDVLPLGDMPNHLARIYILNSLDSNADLQKHYTTDWRLFSFQSTDFILPLLTKLFGMSVGTRIYSTSIFLLLVGGTVAVHRALFGRVGLWPASVLLFLYNLSFAYGQISFLFATGLGLLLFAAWIATVRSHHPIRLAIFVLGTFALFLCHFFAFASYALTVMTFEAYRMRTEPRISHRFIRLAESALPFVIPGVLFVFSFGNSINGETFYGQFAPKVVYALGVMVTYLSWTDLFMTITVVCTLLFLARQKLISFAPEMRLTAMVLILAACAMPRLLVGVLGADLRIPCMLSFLLVASSNVEWYTRRQMVGFALGIIFLLLLRVVTISDQWQKFDEDYREFRTASAQLERASRVVVFPFRQDFRQEPQPLNPYNFIAAFAVIDQQVFLPNLYTFATPLDFTASGAAIRTNQLAKLRKVRWHPTSLEFVAADQETIRQVEEIGQLISIKDLYTSTIDWSDWPERFDYAIDFSLGRFENPVPSLLTEIWRGSYFSIYRIHPPQTQ